MKENNSLQSCFLMFQTWTFQHVNLHVFICFWNQPQVAIRGNAAYETSSLASIFSLGGCCLVPSKG